MLFGILILCSANTLWSQPYIVLNDSLKVLGSIRDLSKLFIWGTNTAPESAFNILEVEDRNGLKFNAITLNDSAIKYSNFNNINGLRAASGFDFKLPTLNRENDTITISFDVMWDSLIQNGEAGRVVAAMLHKMPENDYTFGLLDSTHLEAPFGRPAYHVRILNKNPNLVSAKSVYMIYGGGLDSLGESEILLQNNIPRWWLPGFITEAGGFTPGSRPNYPEGGSYFSFQPIAEGRVWKHITMILLPEALELWQRNTADTTSEKGNLVLRMHLPKTMFGWQYVINRLNQQHIANISSPPTLYRYFPEINGLRFYFRANNRASLTNFRVLTTEQLVTGLPSTQSFTATDQIKIYPNPTNNYTPINIISNATIQANSCLISNVYGQIFKPVEVKAANSKLIVRLPTGLSQGVYRLSVKDQNGKQLNSSLIIR
jgi:hypothetical protein